MFLTMFFLLECCILFSSILLPVLFTVSCEGPSSLCSFNMHLIQICIFGFSFIDISVLFHLTTCLVLVHVKKHIKNDNTVIIITTILNLTPLPLHFNAMSDKGD